jgi:hypothetical protein
VTSANSCIYFREKFLTFRIAKTLQKRPQDGGFVEVVVDYLVSPGSMLHSNFLIDAIRLVIMVKVRHYGCSPVFPFYDIDQVGLCHNYFD